MVTVRLTSQEVQDILSAINCKIVQCERNIKTLDSPIYPGAIREIIEEERQIRRLESLIEKLGY